MRRGRFTWLLFPQLLGFALACGGRYEKAPDDGDDGGSAIGVGGGTSGTMGGTSKGGTSFGGKGGTGGSTGVGGDICLCIDVDCGPSEIAVKDPDGCCYHCQVDVKACLEGRQQVLQFRQQLIEKYQSLGCVRDLDCATVFDGGACGIQSCGIPLPAYEADSYSRNLNEYARSLCSLDCPTEPPTPCPAPPPARCLLNRCTF
jgi:hypothetical protein